MGNWNLRQRTRSSGPAVRAANFFQYTSLKTPKFRLRRTLIHVILMFRRRCFSIPIQYFSIPIQISVYPSGISVYPPGTSYPRQANWYTEIMMILSHHVGCTEMSDAGILKYRIIINYSIVLLKISDLGLLKCRTVYWKSQTLVYWNVARGILKISDFGILKCRNPRVYWKIIHWIGYTENRMM